MQEKFDSVRSIEDLLKHFKKDCSNKMPSFRLDLNGERKIPRSYRNPKLAKFAKEALENGKDEFYVKFVEGETPGESEVKLAEPEYYYHINVSISEEDYNNLIRLSRAYTDDCK